MRAQARRRTRNEVRPPIPGSGRFAKLTDLRPGEDSATVRTRVEAARAAQTARFAGGRTTINAEMAPAEVRAHCQVLLDDDARALLRLAMNRLSLSARAFHRVLKIARTVADLAGKETIAAPHLAEAIQYRRRSTP